MRKRIFLFFTTWAVLSAVGWFTAGTFIQTPAIVHVIITLVISAVPLWVAFYILNKPV